MKMAKKLLAVVLAGVLALSVLTGCGGAVSAKTIAEAMSDVSKDEGFVYEADPELNEKARQIAEMIRTKGKGNDPGKKTDIYGEIMGIMGQGYVNKYVWIAETTTKGNNVTTQASNLLEDVDIDSNINGAVAKGKSPANVRSIGTALTTVNGVDCRLAVITADAVQGKV
jgi:hypothetical protein